MKRHKTRILIAALLLPTSGHAQPQGTAWREAYQSSPTAPRTDAQFSAFVAQYNIPPPIAAHMQPRHVTGTLRYRVTVSADGTQIRLRFSNEAGNAPLVLSAASVGLADAAFGAASGSLHAVTFGGRAGATIPAGAPLLSDPVPIPVAAGSSLVVSLTGPGPFLLSTNGGGALLNAAGDQTLVEQPTSSTAMIGRPLVTAVEVLAPDTTQVVATLGDSITDGNRSTVSALHSWPEELARRLRAEPHGPRRAVANAGIGGNQVLATSASSEYGIAGLARLDRDVLRIDGLSHLIVLEGINDIGNSGKTLLGDGPLLSADDLIFGYRQIMARAHARGVTVIFGTILPFQGASYYTPDKDRVRQAVNAWIRSSGEPDGVIDFDAALRDPAMPSRLQAAFDSGDHLHPNEAGSKAMGDAIDLTVFGRPN